ncbi:MAG: cation diffusion facilitator family transporter [Agathobacter sp.]|nr:cation diffusion facilitator family transporter [Agathobacter sp.]
MLYKLFSRDPESREDIILMTSGLGVFVNILIATLKIIIGFFASSIAIVSEGVNNMSDALTSILTLIGAKLAKMHPDEKHPFGYGRIEYFSSLIISLLILVTGIEMLIGAVKLIFSPEKMSVSLISIIIIAFTAIVKFILGVYTIKMGEKASSSSLIGVGSDCRNDSFASAITIVTMILYLVFHVSLDAYAGIIISFLTIKAGFDVFKETISDLMGRQGERDLANELYRNIVQTEGIIAAADMMLHNYGPDRWSGSVNVEIDHKKTVGEVYQLLHELQLEIMHEYKVTMVFGVYAVDNDHEEMKELRSIISAFVKRNEHIKSFHAVYIEPQTGKVYCDFIVDYKLRDWDSLKIEFEEYMAKEYKSTDIELTIETEFV